MGSAASTNASSSAALSELGIEELAKLAEDADKADVAAVVRAEQIDGAKAATLDDQAIASLSGGEELRRLNLEGARKELLDAAAVAAAYPGRESA